MKYLDRNTWLKKIHYNRLKRYITINRPLTYMCFVYGIGIILGYLFWQPL